MLLLSLLLGEGVREEMRENEEEECMSYAQDVNGGNVIVFSANDAYHCCWTFI